MRISDWSSDVCSSDLYSQGRGSRYGYWLGVGPHAATRIALLVKSLQARRVVAAFFYTAFMFHIVLVSPEIPPNTGNVIRLAANSGASQIGRASCRERVCEYV